MRHVRRAALALALLAGSALSFALPVAGGSSLSGTLSVFFLEEKVGSEEFFWTEEADGFVLRVTGSMAKPLRLDIERMTLSLSRDFIPLEYHFLGVMNGMAQEISSRIEDGRARNIIRVAGQETVLEAVVRRDTLLLPNPLFSPYLVLARKFGCGLKDKSEVSVYLIPQVEIMGTLQAAPADPCALTLDLAGVQASLVLDQEGRLRSLSIPGQSLRVAVEYDGD